MVAVRSYSSGMAARRSPGWAVIARAGWLGAIAVAVGMPEVAAAQPDSAAGAGKAGAAAGAAAAKGKPDADDGVVARPVVGVIDLTDGSDPKARPLVDAITVAIAARPELATAPDSRISAA